jgi:hypothetical protein
MNFLKSYAHQVVSYHPEKARDDLFTELYNELCEEFADWKEEHPEGDEAAFLDAEKDHPMRFATRLAPEGSAYLIGPKFYYSFISALKVAILITAGFHLFLGVISALGSGNYFGSVMRLMISLPATLIWVCTCILGVFIALEKSGDKASWLDNWKASKLASIDGHQTISKTETFFDLGVSLLGLLWLLDIVQFPALVRHDGIWVTGWTTSLPDGFWVAIGILLVLDIAYCIFRLVRNFWSRGLRALSIAFNSVWATLLAFAANQAPLISLNSNDVINGLDLQTLVNNVAVGVIYLVIVILIIDSLKHGWKLLKPNVQTLAIDAG